MLVNLDLHIIFVRRRSSTLLQFGAAWYCESELLALDSLEMSSTESCYLGPYRAVDFNIASSCKECGDRDTGFSRSSAKVTQMSMNKKTMLPSFFDRNSTVSKPIWKRTRKHGLIVISQ
jgi:hypothetical protein